MLIADPLTVLLLARPTQVPGCLAFSSVINAFTFAVSFIVGSTFAKYGCQCLQVNFGGMVIVKDLHVPCKSVETFYSHQKMDKTTVEGWISFVKNSMHRLQIVAVL